MAITRLTARAERLRGRAGPEAAAATPHHGQVLVRTAKATTVAVDSGIRLTTARAGAAEARGQWGRTLRHRPWQERAGRAQHGTAPHTRVAVVAGRGTARVAL